jgi:hypothetical protein
MWGVLREQISLKRHSQVVSSVDFHLVANPFSFNSFLAEIRVFHAVSDVSRIERENTFTFPSELGSRAVSTLLGSPEFSYRSGDQLS